MPNKYAYNPYVAKVDSNGMVWTTSVTDSLAPDDAVSTNSILVSPDGYVYACIYYSPYETYIQKTAIWKINEQTGKIIWKHNYSRFG